MVAFFGNTTANQLGNIRQGIPAGTPYTLSAVDPLAGVTGLTHAPGAFRGQDISSIVTAPDVSPVQDLQYWLDQARGMDTTDWAGLQSGYQDVASQAKNRIAAMYRALQGERKQSGKQYEADRAAAAASISGAADTAANDIKAAYENAYQNQANVAAQLGLDNPLANEAMTAMGTRAAENQATTRNNQARFLSNNATSLADSLAFNRDMIGGAGFASNEGQANIESLLMNRLNDLQLAKQQSGSLSKLLPLAQGLQQFDASLTPGMTFDQQLSAARQAADQQLAMQKLQQSWVDTLMKNGKSYEEASAIANQILAAQQ
jgi:hypothetical protein